VRSSCLAPAAVGAPVIPGRHPCSIRGTPAGKRESNGPNVNLGGVRASARGRRRAFWRGRPRVVVVAEAFRAARDSSHNWSAVAPGTAAARLHAARRACRLLRTNTSVDPAVSDPWFTRQQRRWGIARSTPGDPHRIPPPDGPGVGARRGEFRLTHLLGRPTPLPRALPTATRAVTRHLSRRFGDGLRTAGFPISTGGRGRRAAMASAAPGNEKSRRRSIHKPLQKGSATFKRRVIRSAFRSSSDPTLKVHPASSP